MKIPHDCDAEKGSTKGASFLQHCSWFVWQYVEFQDNRYAIVSYEEAMSEKFLTKWEVRDEDSRG